MLPPLLNFALYFLACLLFWLAALAIYVRITPYPELRLVREGNVAAALSLSGTAIGLAMPLASLAAHAVSLWDLAIWALVALAVQLALWFVLGLTLFRGLRESITQDRRSVGLVVGAFSASVGLLNAASLTY